MSRLIRFVLCYLVILVVFFEQVEVKAQQNTMSNEAYFKETKVSLSYCNERAVETKMEYGPVEIKYGDIIYVDWFETNVSDKIVAQVGGSSHDRLMRLAINNLNFSSRGYLYSPEFNDTITAPKNPTPKDFEQKTGKEVQPMEGAVEAARANRYYLRPGCSFEHRPLAIECPPLEDWNDPFWKELREKMTPEGVVCKIEMSHYDRGFSFNVLVKPRLSSELDLLEGWFKSTPSELYPKKSKWWNRKLTWETFLDDRSVELSPVIIKNKSYPVYFFMRYGSRKPGVPNVPKTVEEWKLLEDRFQPSTLRDEITFARMQLEYYGAENLKVRDEKLNSLVRWIQSLPVPQNSVYTDLIMERLQRDFPAGTEIRQDLRELAVRLAPLRVDKLENTKKMILENNLASLQEYDRQEASEANLKKYRELATALTVIDRSIKENKWLTDKQIEALKEARQIFENERVDIERIDPTTVIVPPKMM